MRDYLTASNYNLTGHPAFPRLKHVRHSVLSRKDEMFYDDVEFLDIMRCIEVQASSPSISCSGTSPISSIFLSRSHRSSRATSEYSGSA